MQFLYLFLCTILLFGCSSTEKNSYDSLIKDQNDFLAKERNSSREIAYLKNLSEFEEGNFQFIIKQMKEVVKNYNKMKQQLVKIESKMDNLLTRQTLGQNSPKNNEVKEESKLLTEEDEQENEETILSEESSLLPEEMTDDTDIFEEKELKENKYLQNQQDALSKIVADNKESNEKKPSSLIEAKKFFEEKSYENAISQFQRYRDKNPKGSHYPEATFYIGQSFKNLEMPIEAGVFFKEIINSYPQSLWASRAKKLLEE